LSFTYTFTSAIVYCSHIEIYLSIVIIFDTSNNGKEPRACFFPNA